jgi:hypothetical protein
MRRSASEVIRNLEMRIARLEKQANPFAFSWSEEAFSTLVMGRVVESDEGYSATVEDDNGIAMFTMTLEYTRGGSEKISWKSQKMTKQDIQVWGEALQKKLRASSPVEAWVAIIEGANKGDRLSSPAVIRRAKNSL